MKRALERRLEVEIHPGTFAFGAAFEHFVILELARLRDYFHPDFDFSYLRTKNGLEVDLVIDRPGGPTALVEIKSTEQVGPRDVTALNRLAGDFGNAEAFCLSLDPHRKKIGAVLCLPWWEGPAELGLTP